MVNNTKCQIIIHLILLISLTFTQIVQSQQNERKDTIKNDTKVINAKDTIPSQTNISQEDIVKKLEQKLDKTLSLLNTGLLLISVLVILITLVIIIFSSVGILEFRKIVEKRKDLVIYVEDAKKELTWIYEKKQEVENFINQTEQKVIKVLQGGKIVDNFIKETEDKFEELKRSLKDQKEYIDPVENKFKPLLLGVSLFGKGSYHQALEIFNNVLQKYPKDALVLIGKAHSLQKIGKHKEAIEIYSEVLSSDFKLKSKYYVELLNNKGCSYLELDIPEVDEALNLFRKAIEIQPDYAEPYYNIAIIYARKDDLDNTIKYLSDAFSLKHSLKKEAKKDEEFMKFRSNQKFIEITS